MSNYKVTQYKILVWLCGVQSISDMSGSGISTLLLPPPLLNNILNFKVIFQPPLITSPSPQHRVDRDQCTVSVVFMIKRKSIMIPCSQLSFVFILSWPKYKHQFGAARYSSRILEWWW